MECTIKENFYKNGLWVIDNFLPLELANRINEEMTLSNSYNQVSQDRKNHYKTFLKTDFDNFPLESDVYQASFKKNEEIVKKNRPLFADFHFFIKEQMKDLSHNSVRFYTRPLCYKMTPGDHLRLHKDLYAGEVGYTFYANKSWCWDWGGTFNFYSPEKQEMYQILPKFNRVIFRNEKIKLFHFVSPVTKFAQIDRLSINGWASAEDKTKELKNKTIGEYYSD